MISLGGVASGLLHLSIFCVFKCDANKPLIFPPLAKGTYFQYSTSAPPPNKSISLKTSVCKRGERCHPSLPHFVTPFPLKMRSPPPLSRLRILRGEKQHDKIVTNHFGPGREQRRASRGRRCLAKVAEVIAQVGK